MDFTLFENILKKHNVSYVADYLNLTESTIKRWIDKQNIPDAYYFALLKLSNKKIDYSKFTYKQKDQFYTPIETAKYCFNRFKQILNIYNENEQDIFYVEPSAGSGSFLKTLPTDRTIGLDIEPNGDNILQQDFLTWTPNEYCLEKKVVVIGNPPFGLRGQLALQFINHSFNFADYVCFILPQLFESDGKGVPRKRVKGFHLIYSEKINSDFLDPQDNKIKVNCIFQIWSKHHQCPKYDIQNIDCDEIKIYSLSDGGTSSTTRNKNMLYSCDVYVPSTCFGKENMRSYNHFDDLPGRRGYGIVLQNKKHVNKMKSIDWGQIAFLSTNSAFNLRRSQIFEIFQKL